MLVSESKKPAKTALTCEPLSEASVSALHKSSSTQLMDDLINLKTERSTKLHLKSKLHMAIGFTLSLLMVILAFEWRVYDRGELVDLGDVEADFDEILEIPQTEQPPPPPPKKIISPIIREVDDEVIVKEIELELDVEATEDMIIEEVTNFEFIGNEVEEEQADVIYDIVQSKPEPIGGMQAFYEYVKDNLEYPERARRLGVSGRVYIQFVVEKDGSLTDVQVIKGLFEECDKEAVRVIQNAPKWSPGKQRGRPVRVYQRLPIMFILRE